MGSEHFGPLTIPMANRMGRFLDALQTSERDRFWMGNETIGAGPFLKNE